MSVYVAFCRAKDCIAFVLERLQSNSKMLGEQEARIFVADFDNAFNGQRSVRQQQHC